MGVTTSEWHATMLELLQEVVWALMGTLSRKLELDRMISDLLSSSMRGDDQMWMLIILLGVVFMLSLGDTFGLYLRSTTFVLLMKNNKGLLC